MRKLSPQSSFEQVSGNSNNPAKLDVTINQIVFEGQFKCSFYQDNNYLGTASIKLTNSLKTKDEYYNNFTNEVNDGGRSLSEWSNNNNNNSNNIYNEN